MKKLISLTLALLLVFSLATVAGATTSNITDNKVTITKVYELEGTGTSPEETLTFTTVTAYSVTDAAEGVNTSNMPMISIESGIVLTSGMAGSENKSVEVDITIPGVSSDPSTITMPADGARFSEYPSVGIYKYTFSEVNGGMAGVTYYDKTMTVVVSVVQDESGLLRVAGVHCENPVVPSYDDDPDEPQKTDTFTNTYSAAQLSVGKTVSGEYGELGREFTIYVDFEAPKNSEGKYLTIGADITTTDGSAETHTIYKDSDDWSDGKVRVTLTLKDDDVVTFTNIPEGVKYTVTEASYTADGYDDPVFTQNNVELSTDTTSAEGTIVDGTDQSVSINNNKGGDIDTGITLDSIPFILILAVCAGAVVLFVVKRRRSVDF